MHFTNKKKINVIIPCYNESKRIPRTLNAYYKYFYEENSEFASEFHLELIVVNDGSKDNTSKLAQEFIKDHKIEGHVMSYDVNQGKGYAVKYGMLNSRKADYYYLADADLSSPWSVLPKLVKEIDEDKYDCVIGSRAVTGSHVSTSSHRLASGRLSNLLINSFLDLGLKDTQCGYKLFNQSCLEAFRKQTIDRWGFDFEILYIMKLLGLKIKEVGIEWENREGSNVKFSDYFATLKQLYKVKSTKYV